MLPPGGAPPPLLMTGGGLVCFYEENAKGLLESDDIYCGPPTPVVAALPELS